MKRISVLLAIGVLAAIGCGDDEEPADVEPKTPDEEAILDVVENYELATKEGDAALFCDEVLVDGQRAGCADVIQEAMNDPESDLSSEEQITVLEIKVDGDLADVTIDDDGRRYTTTFRKTDVGWRFQVFD